MHTVLLSHASAMIETNNCSSLGLLTELASPHKSFVLHDQFTARWLVTDLEEAVHWYQHVLNFSVQIRQVNYLNSAERFAKLWLNEFWIELLELPSSPSQKSFVENYQFTDSSFCLSISVLNIDELTQRALFKGGCEITKTLTDYGDFVKFCFLRTSNNQTFKLIQRLHEFQ